MVDLAQILGSGVSVADLVDLRDEEEFISYLESIGINIDGDSAHSLKSQFEMNIMFRENNTESSLTYRELDSVAGGVVVGNENANAVKRDQTISMWVTIGTIAATLLAFAPVAGQFAASMTAGAIVDATAAAGGELATIEFEAGVEAGSTVATVQAVTTAEKALTTATSDLNAALAEDAAYTELSQAVTVEREAVLTGMREAAVAEKEVVLDLADAEFMEGNYGLTDGADLMKAQAELNEAKAMTNDSLAALQKSNPDAFREQFSHLKDADGNSFVDKLEQMKPLDNADLHAMRGRTPESVEAFNEKFGHYENAKGEKLVDNLPKPIEHKDLESAKAAFDRAIDNDVNAVERYNSLPDDLKSKAKEVIKLNDRLEEANSRVDNWGRKGIGTATAMLVGAGGQMGDQGLMDDEEKLNEKMQR